MMPCVPCRSAEPNSAKLDTDDEVLPKACLEMYRALGYCVLRGVLDKRLLGLLRAECDERAERKDLIACGCIVEPLSIIEARERPDSERCSRRAYAKSRSLPVSQILLSPESKLVRAVHRLLGTGAYFCQEQYIIKPPQAEQSAFLWHRDDECIAAQKTPYVSMWFALDDVFEYNGALQVSRPGDIPLPHSNARRTTILDVNAGDCIAIRSDLYHRSGPNLTNSSRRAWMPQYATAPLTRHDGMLAALGIPLVTGKRKRGPSDSGNDRKRQHCIE